MPSLSATLASPRKRSYVTVGTHLFVEFDVLCVSGDGHEPEQPPQLLPASRVLQLQAELQCLQSLLQFTVY